MGEGTEGGLNAGRRASEQLLEPWLGGEAMKPAAPIEGLVAQSRILFRQFSGEEEERLQIDWDFCYASRASHT